MHFSDQHFHRDKHLLRLERELNRLSRAQWKAPIVPLARPYQSGWTKSLTLRDDAWHHPDVAVFQGILGVVNQRVHSRRADFLDRSGRPIVVRPRVLNVGEWRQLAWPVRYQRLFAHGHWPVETLHAWMARLITQREVGFKLMSTWWLVECVRPRLITHQRVDLPEVRSRIAEIERHLTQHLGRERLSRLHGRRVRWRERKPAGLPGQPEIFAVTLDVTLSDCPVRYAAFPALPGLARFR